MTLHLLFITTNTAIDGNESAPLYIKLLFGINLPLVMAMAAQRVALVFLF